MTLGMFVTAFAFYCMFTAIPKYRNSKYFRIMLLAIIIVFTLAISLSPKEIDLIYRLMLGFGYGLMIVIFGIYVAKQRNKKG
ncbi:hypothetical protein [Solimicrobium silvestre]|uniref:Uncharacterized protein n=1 Tax=Solimicrobium silvestre TaxID=2099400 RepID=A0A2S9GYP4_9BURK|nr:hypothetical protein [Solimicrobium silvestre]PRC92847.1 hypothetical protein S2091_2577 [Solimicrobium silvestre]